MSYLTLTGLAIVSSGTGYHDDDTAFAIFSYWLGLCHVWENLTDEIDGSSDVDVHYEFEV
jgi:hypothetical protein